MADPDYIWLEGFERWGSLGAAQGGYGFDTYQDDGEYTSTSSGSGFFIDGLVPSAGGVAFQGSAGSNSSWSKTLGSNFARVIGGITMYNLLASANATTFVAFNDGGTNQMQIGYNTSGQLWIARNGTIVATSTETFANGSINVIEWDITFHNTTGIGKVWLNGVATTINFSGDTCGTANNYCNAFTLTCSRNNAVDHFYLWFYTAAGGSETPALTNPVIETTTIDSVVSSDFTLGLGLSVSDELLQSGGSINRTGRTTYFRPFVAPASGDITKIFAYPFVTSATIACKASIYADDGTGKPGARLCAPVTVTGFTAGTVITFNIAATAVTQGTTYHIAFSHDNAAGTAYFGSWQSDITKGWQTADASYAAAQPNPALGSPTAVAPPWVWANITNITAAHEWTQLAFNHPDATYHYLASSTVNHRDKFGFADLSVNPAVIYGITVTYAVSKSDAGVKTMDLEIDSGGVIYTGSTLQNGTGKTPPQTMNWYTAAYPKNPDGSVAWTKTSLDAMGVGYKITA